MYEMLIKEYLKKLSINDIDNFALKNNITLKYGENKIIYDFIKQRWMEVYSGNTYAAFNYLKIIMTEPIRVLQVVASLNAGGMENYIMNL